jgi:hypothetical protein
MQFAMDADGESKDPMDRAAIHFWFTAKQEL